jgi:hypothetical protein
MSPSNVVLVDKGFIYELLGAGAGWVHQGQYVVVALNLVGG